MQLRMVIYRAAAEDVSNTVINEIVVVIKIGRATSMRAILKA